MSIAGVDLAALAPLLLALIATGLLGGVLAGMLGVGGGIVIVPVLEYMLRFTSVPSPWRMNVAVATSLATIIPTALSSSLAHHRRGALDWSLVRSWWLPMLTGSAAGSLVASFAHGALLSAVFGGVAAVVALKMLLPLDALRLAPAVPRGLGGAGIAAGIGGVSAMMGIGGGTVSVPLMTLCGEPIHRAIGTAAFFGLVIGLPGTIIYLLARPGVELPFATVGLVSLLGVALITPGTTLTAPLGARLAHALSRRALSAAFGSFLVLVAARMLFRAMTA